MFAGYQYRLYIITPGVRDSTKIMLVPLCVVWLLVALPCDSVCQPYQLRTRTLWTFQYRKVARHCSVAQQAYGQRALWMQECHWRFVELQQAVEARQVQQAAVQEVELSCVVCSSSVNSHYQSSGLMGTQVQILQCSRLQRVQPLWKLQTTSSSLSPLRVRPKSVVQNQQSEGSRGTYLVGQWFCGQLLNWNIKMYIIQLDFRLRVGLLGRLP